MPIRRRLPRWGRTLTSRIVLSTMAASAITMAAMVSAVFVILTSQQHRIINSRLNDRIDAVKATLEVRDGKLSNLPINDDPIDDTTWVFGASGNLVTGPAESSRQTSVAASLSSVTREKTITINDHVFRAVPVTVDGVDAVIVSATSAGPYEEARAVALIGLVALSGVVTAGSAAVAAVTVRRTLAPIDQMAEDAHDWSARHLDTRFDVVGTDEFTRLGTTLNELLDRVAAALRNEQRLTSELAHELRTPLTAIRGEIELSMLDPSSGDARLTRAVGLIDDLSGVISTLLAIARDLSRDDSTCTAGEVVERALAAVDVDAPRIVVEALPVDPLGAQLDLAVRAIAPLIDNARRHAAATVTIAGAVGPRAVTVTVTDDGAGVAGDDEQIFVSGRRGPDSTGAGLGLALARRVARTLGGDVRLVSRAHPTTFALTLPLA